MAGRAVGESMSRQVVVGMAMEMGAVRVWAAAYVLTQQCQGRLH